MMGRVALQVWRVGRIVRAAGSFIVHGICCLSEGAGLLRLSDQVVKELLYIPEVARQKLFFRRVRVVPLFSVYWNNIFISHSVRMVLLSLAEDRDACVANCYAAVARIKRMKAIVAEPGLPVDDLQFMEDTFRILALARE